MPSLINWCKDHFNKNSNHEITNGIIALKGGNIDDELNSIKEIKISKINDIFDIEYFHDKKIVYVPSNSIYPLA